MDKAIEGLIILWSFLPGMGEYATPEHRRGLLHGFEEALNPVHGFESIIEQKLKQAIEEGNGEHIPTLPEQTIEDQIRESREKYEYQSGVAGGNAIVNTADDMATIGTVGYIFTRGILKATGINCFPRDTLVSTEHGLRPICEVKAGDKVWSFDFIKGEWRLCEVEARHDNPFDGRLVTITTDEGSVTATEYHPFWVVRGKDFDRRTVCRELAVNEDQGGRLEGRWVNSHELQEGDVVFQRRQGEVVVRHVRIVGMETEVCNLTIPELHTFTVGLQGLLVHNVSGSGWGAGNFGSAEASLKWHFAKHGSEVGATTEAEYLKKATAAAGARKGRGVPIDGHTHNVRRYDVHGTTRYVDVDELTGEVISYGERK